MPTLTVRIRANGTSGKFKALRKRGEPWQDAAGRAIRRAAGRSAVAWSWQNDGWEQDNNGRRIVCNYKATIVEHSKKHRNGYPVLGEARVQLWESEIDSEGY